MEKIMSGDESIVAYKYKVTQRADGWWEIRAHYMDVSGNCRYVDQEALLSRPSIERLLVAAKRITMAVEECIDSDS